MQHQIKKYPVVHPFLKNYIRFFWEIHSENIQLNHKLIPQKYINLRFNLNDTPQYLSVNGLDHRLESGFFTGLLDRFGNAQLKMAGKVDVIGICFQPDGFFPFLNIPVSEVKNQVLGLDEVGFRLAGQITARLREASDVAARLNILEEELLTLLHARKPAPDDFRKIFGELRNNDHPVRMAEFCSENQIGVRKLERMFSKYVGVSAMTFCTLNRFQNSLNQLLHADYQRLSDIAYDNGYYDQMHFIKDFKHFTGNTPTGFVSNNDSMLQVGKLV